MSNKVYDSGPLAGLTSSNPITVNHNFGKIPGVYAVYQVVSGVEQGWPHETVPLSPGVYIDSFTETSAVIKCREGYSFPGEPKLVMFD